MKIYEFGTKMLLNNRMVYVVGNDLETIECPNDLNYYVSYSNPEENTTDGGFYDIMVHHSELSPVVNPDISISQTSLSNVVKILEENAKNNKEKIRPYIALVSSDYVRDTQISSIGDFVEDLFSEDLVVKNDKGKLEEAYPFMEGRYGDFTNFEDTPCDFEAPVYLGIYHFLESVSEAQIRASIAINERIPLQYIILLPLDPTISTTEWQERAMIL